MGSQMHWEDQSFSEAPQSPSHPAPSFSYEHGYPAPSPTHAHFLGGRPTSTASNAVQVAHVLLELGPTALDSDEDKLHKVENLVRLFPPLSPGIPHSAWLIEETECRFTIWIH